MREIKITKTTIDVASVRVKDSVPDEGILRVLGEMDEHEQIEWNLVEFSIDWHDEKDKPGDDKDNKNPMV